jgi:DNA-binding IclR family transcriptional regulator
MEEKAYYKVSSLERGLRVLELLAEKGSLKVSEVASHLGLHRSAAHRFLATLKELNYVVQDPSSRYRLSLRIFEMGMSMVNALGIRQISRPFMEELARLSNETVNLGFWDGREIIYIDKIKSREVLLTDLAIGTRVPAYCSAMGKAILAFRPREDQDAFVQSTKFDPLTPRTNTNPQRFLRELERIREVGFAIDDEEMVAGIRCIAAPVTGLGEYPDYALSISGPLSRINDDGMTRLADELKRVCNNLSSRQILNA